MVRALLDKVTRERLLVFGPALLVAIVGFWAAYQYVGPAPPTRIVMGAGPEGGEYAMFAERYREVLARDRITLEVRPSAGAVENIERLEKQEAGIDIAFVQGGTVETAGTKGLRSIASLYYEPVWVFYRGAKRLGRLTDLRGKRIAIGREGSGTAAVALSLLNDDGMSGPPTTLLSIGGQEAAEALLGGGVDVAFFVASARSEVVRKLATTDEVRLMSFERADAYLRKYSHAANVTLPEGLLDLETNIPPFDITLPATTANLVVRKDFHPALVDLILEAAKEIHGPGGLFEGQGEFPSPKYVEFPLSHEANRYYEHGPPALRGYLPFWAATFASRMLVLLIPAVVLLWPLFKVVPPAYKWRVEAKVYRWYKHVNAIEARLHETRSPEGVRGLLDELDHLEEAIDKISVPLSYTGRLYNLRMHLNLVREKVRRAMNDSAAAR